MEKRDNSLFEKLRTAYNLEDQFHRCDSMGTGLISAHEFLAIMRETVGIDDVTAYKFVQVYDEMGHVSYVNILADMSSEGYVMRQVRSKASEIRHYLRGLEQNGIVSSDQFKQGLARAGIQDNMLTQAYRLSRLYLTGNVPYDLLLKSIF